MTTERGSGDSSLQILGSQLLYCDPEVSSIHGLLLTPPLPLGQLSRKEGQVYSTAVGAIFETHQDPISHPFQWFYKNLNSFVFQ